MDDGRAADLSEYPDDPEDHKLAADGEERDCVREGARSRHCRGSGYYETAYTFYMGGRLRTVSTRRCQGNIRSTRTGYRRYRITLRTVTLTRTVTLRTVTVTVGTITLPRWADVTPSAAVLVLSETIIHPTPTPNAYCNPTIEYSAWFSRLPDMSAEMPLNETLLKSIDKSKTIITTSLKNAFTNFNISKKLENSKINKNKNLLHFPTPDIYFSEVMTIADKTSVKNFIDVIKSNNNKYFGDLCIPSHMKRFAKVSNNTNEAIFQPMLFLEQMRSQVDFMDAVVNTQLFLSFAQKKIVQNAYNETVSRCLL